jgi:hypothetical protein
LDNEEIKISVEYLDEIYDGDKLEDELLKKMPE